MSSSLRLVAQLDGSLRAMLNKRTDEIGEALRAAVESASESLQTELRGQVTAAGLGSGLANAWRLEVYPQSSRKSMRPAGLVYSKAVRLHRAFNSGEVIRARNAHWLVIPLEAAVNAGLATNAAKGSGGGTARKWSNVDAAIDVFGELRFVPIGGNRALLLADRNSRTATRQRGGRPGGRGKDFIALFLLVRQVSGKKVLDIEGAGARALSRLQTNLSNIVPRG